MRTRIGSWSLPSGNGADVFFSNGHIVFRWDVPPSLSWPQADREHYERVVRPLVIKTLTARGLVAL
jgi:hypothetical protein